MTVTNIGDVIGKDVVEVYVNVPYTNYDKTHHIEKSATSLVGFAKTGEIDVGDHETVTIEVDSEYFRSYNDVNAKTYILEDGDYYLTAAKDAHEATNNFLIAQGYKSGTTSFVDRITFDEPGEDYKIFNESKSGAN